MTIDGGTTNTRVCILDDKNVIVQSTHPIGVRCYAVSKSKTKFLEGLSKAIRDTLDMAGVGPKDLQMVVASGMITSNLGIYEIPHVKTPIGLEGLVEASQMAIIPKLMEIPILFIPGVKNNCLNYNGDSFENLEAMDIMRGEETETLGILKIKSLNGPLIMILPGSHTKIIKVDRYNQIVSCMTTMAGEIFNVLATKTILADSIPQNLITQIDKEYILKGAAISHKVGLTRGCFSIRVMSQFLPIDENKRANFLLGVVLGQDLIAIKNSLACSVKGDEKIVIGGPAPLRLALYHLLSTQSDIKEEIIVLDDNAVGMSTAIGAREIGLRYLKKHGGKLIKKFYQNE
ncbi:2-dehydro-3-deoxygalactonokinase [Thermoanaerobacterium sp. DL9XJH110]|uniref:2-dehydro-3-deoxygalactonokinase n=1 Tax=Thermoanaerobacterium sp. DL9XJH110 TaxID=3386643 RepID=UPI003BB4DFD3